MSVVIALSVLAGCSRLIELIEPEPKRGPDFCLISNAGNYRWSYAEYDTRSASWPKNLRREEKDLQAWIDHDCGGIIAAAVDKP